MYREKRKDRFVRCFLAVMIILLFAGCGKTISDERIVIHKYKNLKIDMSDETIGASEGEDSEQESMITADPEQESMIAADLEQENVIATNTKPKSTEDKVWEALLTECTVKEYPEEEVAELAEKLKTLYGYAAYYQGMDGEQLIQKVHGMTAEELAKEQLKKEYAIALIAKEEELQVSEEEYISELQSRAEEAGYEDYEEYEGLFEKEEWVEMILEERVLEFLLNHKN